jgi:hypothetical protein
LWLSGIVADNPRLPLVWIWFGVAAILFAVAVIVFQLN